MGRAYQNRKESMAKTAAAKTKTYSKYGREIYMCAKASGLDPAGNHLLRSLIDRAKKDQVPSHVIERAIDKARGGGGEDFAPARYEGYGPGGCLIIVECLTDNPTRTYNDVRQCFSKTKAKLGNTGSVSHMFDHCAILVFDGESEDTVLEALLTGDVDVTDVEHADGKITVFTPNTEYGKAKRVLGEAIGVADYDLDEIQFIPQNTTEIVGDDAVVLEKLLGMLNELDDVQNIYHNATL